jgi:hypothetical protein
MLLGFFSVEWFIAGTGTFLYVHARHGMGVHPQLSRRTPSVMS